MHKLFVITLFILCLIGLMVCAPQTGNERLLGLGGLFNGYSNQRPYYNNGYYPGVGYGGYYPQGGSGYPYGGTGGGYYPGAGGGYPGAAGGYPGGNGFYPSGAGGYGTNILGGGNGYAGYGGYGGYGGNGGHTAYNGYNNINYDGQRNLGYGYYRGTNSYGFLPTSNVISGYRGYN